jgi:PAS domain-containing protein
MTSRKHTSKTGKADSADALNFLDAPGSMPQALRSHDWSTSALGHPSTWPAPLKAATRQMLNSAHPMAIWWGEERSNLFNDAHQAVVGDGKLLPFLGIPARHAWGHHWELIESEIEHVMCGRGATWNRDRMFTRIRDGVREETFWNYSFSPIYDATATHGVGGVMLDSMETTELVLAERRLVGKLARQEQQFMAAPGFIAILRGPNHVFEFVNRAYKQLMGDREFIGRSVAEVVPEVRDQEYPRILDRVYATGKRFATRAMPLTVRRGLSSTTDTRLINFVYEPIRDADGVVVGIFVEGFDVTEITDSQEPETHRSKSKSINHPAWQPLF